MLRRNKATSSKGVYELLQMIAQDKLCLPSFQRQFVWKPTQLAKLIESIVRHYPIGTLMFLKKEGNPGLGAEPFLENNSGSFDPKYYVIDGQQRLKTLLFTLNPPLNLERQYHYLQRPYSFLYRSDMSLKNILRSEEIDNLTFIEPTKSAEDVAEDKVVFRSTKLIP